jgi:diguanylate cyclase (GGDEF)-like protein
MGKNMDSHEYAERFKLLSGMSMLLQSCSQEKELFDVTCWYLPKIFPNNSGAVFLVSGNDKKLSPAFSWPDSDNDKIPDLANCRAFLKGLVVDSITKKDISCEGCELGSYCVPFREDKDSFGVFCLKSRNKNILSSSTKGFAFITTEYLSLAISNIRLKTRLHELSIRDPLTKLYNRRYMNDIVDRETNKARRSGATLGMIMVDLDHFKHINDKFGHDAGDEVLRKVACVLESDLRSEDIVCRFGGEEFFILLCTGNYQDYINRSQELRKRIKALDIFFGGQQIAPLSASFGVGVFPDHGKTFEEILKIADQALYIAKERGRNQVVGGFEVTQL